MRLNTPLFHLGKLPVSAGRLIVWAVIAAGLVANYYVWADILQ